MDQLLIRTAKKSDWSALENIFYSNRPKVISWLNPKRPPDDLREQSKGEHILVAEKAGKILGFLSVWEPEHFIHHLYVDKNHQRMGIGKNLVIAAQNKYQKALRLKCGVNNTSALKFYCNTGWTEIDTGESEDGPYLLMELETIKRM